MNCGAEGKRKPIGLMGAIVVVLPLAVETVEAVSLYWGKTPVHTTKLRECPSFANEVMWNLNFQNIRLSRDELCDEIT